jgi:hypothetical protein
MLLYILIVLVLIVVVVGVLGKSNRQEQREVVIGSPEFDELFHADGSLKDETYGDESFIIVPKKG